MTCLFPINPEIVKTPFAVLKLRLESTVDINSTSSPLFGFKEYGKSKLEYKLET